jgi:hypothetical protein
MANYPFPNQRLELGSTGRFVADLQRELNVAVTGVFDFLTMCKVVLHKFENGLNHNEPTVDETTWNSVFRNNRGNDEGEQDPARRDDNGPRLATVGQVRRGDNTEDRGEDNNRGDNDRRPDVTTPDLPTAAPAGQDNEGRDEGNTGATLNGVTNATDDNGPAVANPDNGDAPREDQPTTTAEEQQNLGGPAGGYTATPTATAANTPSPAESDAGAESAQADDNGPGIAAP